MNPGPIEEGGKIAVSVVDGLRSQPLALAVILVNVLFLVFLVWVFHEIAATNRLERQMKADMLEQLKFACEACKREKP